MDTLSRRLSSRCAKAAAGRAWHAAVGSWELSVRLPWGTKGLRSKICGDKDNRCRQPKNLSENYGNDRQEHLAKLGQGLAKKEARIAKPSEDIRQVRSLAKHLVKIWRRV